MGWGLWPWGRTFSGVTFCPVLPTPLCRGLIPWELVVYVAHPRRKGASPSPSPSSSLSLGLVDEVHPLGSGSPCGTRGHAAGLWHQLASVHIPGLQFMR